MEPRACAVAVGVAAMAFCAGCMKTLPAKPDVIMTMRNPSTKSFQATNTKPLPLLPILAPGAYIGPEDHAASSEMHRASPASYGPPEEANLSVFPYTASAKLVFLFPSTPPGWHNECSGQFVGASDVLLTAAHCVYDKEKREWIRSLTANRSYRLGAQIESHDWDCAAIYSGWPQGQYRRDYAFLKMRTRSPAWMSIDYSVPATIESTGYPSNYSNGEILMRVTGNTGARTRGVVQMTANPFGKGSSGGAWHVNGSAVSVNSFKYTNDQSSMWGPALDGEARLLFDYVNRGCTDGALRAAPEEQLASIPADAGVIYVGKATPPAGPMISKVISAECPCGRTTVINPTTDSYEAEVRISGNDKVATKRLMLAPGRSETLECAEANAGRCVSVSSEIARAAKLPNGITTSTFGQRSAQCKSACTSSPIDQTCMSLGRSAAIQLAPLAGFISEDLRREPKGGVIATVSDLIVRFGGNPSNSQDPCSRSSFISDGENITNSGLDCIAATPEQENKLRLGISAPALAIATPTSASTTAFNRRVYAPSITFSGPDASEFDSRYGGPVASVETVGTKLIVTTEKGCLIADPPGGSQ